MSTSNPKPKDYLVVGAGLAGLHCALRLKKAKPKANITVAELYNYVGGRVYTYTPKDYPNIHWESGAGRIHQTHTMVKDYIQSYNLTPIPIPAKTEFRSSQDPQHPHPDTWTGLSQYLVSTLSSLTPSLLTTHSIRELLTETQGKAKTDALLSHFSYRAEMDVMRADLALESLKKEMGPSTNFFVLKEGLGALAKAMHKEAESLGIEFLLGHRLTSVKHKVATFVVEDTNTRTTIYADHIVLALHNKALRAISPFKSHPLLHKVIMCPLLRIYGIFDKPWFSGLAKTITDGPLRFVIPISERDGTIMVSYTDASDTQIWSSMPPKKLEKEILKELRALFPEREIPAPLYLKTHLWKAGCSYWAPGNYDPEQASEQILQPIKTMPSVYVCGESWSLKQAWIEGALEHAELLLKTHLLST